MKLLILSLCYYIQTQGKKWNNSSCNLNQLFAFTFTAELREETIHCTILPRRRGIHFLQGAKKTTTSALHYYNNTNGIVRFFALLVLISQHTLFLHHCSQSVVSWWVAEFLPINYLIITDDERQHQRTSIQKSCLS